MDVYCIIEAMKKAKTRIILIHKLKKVSICHIRQLSNKSEVLNCKSLGYMSKNVGYTLYTHVYRPLHPCLALGGWTLQVTCICCIFLTLLGFAV